uniref:Uncharacterized protein n=1 Tax=Timema douglasi TaxID=61478 RepID=A0A7R8VLP1_TIMDO|nr:unnamed protein product [Timema douglasi]
MKGQNVLKKRQRGWSIRDKTRLITTRCRRVKLVKRNSGTQTCSDTSQVKVIEENGRLNLNVPKISVTYEKAVLKSKRSLNTGGVEDVTFKKTMTKRKRQKTGDHLSRDSLISYATTKIGKQVTKQTKLVENIPTPSVLEQSSAQGTNQIVCLKMSDDKIQTDVGNTTCDTEHSHDNSQLSLDPNTGLFSKQLKSLTNTNSLVTILKANIELKNANIIKEHIEKQNQNNSSPPKSCDQVINRKLFTNPKTTIPPHNNKKTTADDNQQSNCVSEFSSDEALSIVYESILPLKSLPDGQSRKKGAITIDSIGNKGSKEASQESFHKHTSDENTVATESLSDIIVLAKRQMEIIAKDIPSRCEYVLLPVSSNKDRSGAIFYAQNDDAHDGPFPNQTSRSDSNFTQVDKNSSTSQGPSNASIILDKVRNAIKMKMKMKATVEEPVKPALPEIISRPPRSLRSSSRKPEQMLEGMRFFTN